MNSKLTLSFDSRIINKAKIFAKKRNLSLSKLVENYFKTLTEGERNQSEIVITDTELLKISGDIDFPESMDEKDILTDQLIKKYVH